MYVVNGDMMLIIKMHNYFIFIISHQMVFFFPVCLHVYIHKYVLFDYNFGTKHNACTFQ